MKYFLSSIYSSAESDGDYAVVSYDGMAPNGYSMSVVYFQDAKPIHREDFVVNGPSLEACYALIGSKLEALPPAQYI